MAHKRKSKLFLHFRFYAFEDAEKAWEMVLGNTNRSCLQDFAFTEMHLFLFLKLFSTALAMTYAQIVSLDVHVSGSTIQDIIHDLQ